MSAATDGKPGKVVKSKTGLAVGDRVTCVVPPKGRDGIVWSSDAVVHEVHPRRLKVTVRVAYRRVREDRFHWSEVVEMHPSALTPREFPSSAFHEPMEMTVGGFELRPWLHPTAGRPRMYPQGIWYGDADGHNCTSPCTSPDEAIRVAHRAVTGGSLRAGLLTAIECHEGWLTQGDKWRLEAEAKLPILREALAKYDAAFPEVAERHERFAA